jgi:bifunctional non-homologous end joining protein LigD
VWEAGALEWIGHARITDVDRQRLALRLRRRARKSSPFRVAPETSTPATWVRPELVVEVAFTEWTRAGMLRHARYVGLRDDVAPESVRREVAARPAADATRSSRPRRPRARSAPAPSHTAERSRTDELSRTAERMPLPAEARALLSQLQRIEEEGGGGVLELPGTRLRVTGLDRVFWPASRITKGELMRYYATVAGVLLPNVAERPLVMRLHPRGVGAPARYQQRAPAGTPPGVRVEKLPFDRVVPRRLIGGSLPTLLYQAQIGAISQDPFFSRVGSIDFPDHAVLDLDPMPGVAFRRVLDVALWVRDELAALGAAAFPKTSGASGAHVYVPLAPRTPYAAARLFCQLVATSVAQRHPRVATVERSIHARGRRVYVDYLQNSRGKTLATAYSARATDFAGVSMPLAWRDVEAGVEPRDFDVRSSVRRIVTRDPWRALRESAGADLRQVVETRRRRSSR